MEIEVSEKEKRRSDPYIWGIIIILYIVSVVEVYSAISREITGGDVYSPIIKHIMLLFSGGNWSNSFSLLSAIVVIS